jgi:NTE family protein
VAATDQGHDAAPRRPVRRALVLGGGGVAGIAWLLGLIDGLRREGVDLATADAFVGTSAGACVAVQLATGALSEAVAMQRAPETAEIEVEFDQERYLETATDATSGTSDDRESARRLANIDRVVSREVAPERRRAAVAARLPVHRWPHRDLRIAAVDQADGELLAFGPQSGVDLVDAVTASCAVPGVWPAVEIAGRRYVDGGARSPTNADLARGSEIVVVLAPMALADRQRSKLEGELDATAAPQRHVVEVDASSQEAIGANPLSPARREAALEAGLAQAHTERDALARIWGG